MKSEAVLPKHPRSRKATRLGPAEMIARTYGLTPDEYMLNTVLGLATSNGYYLLCPGFVVISAGTSLQKPSRERHLKKDGAPSSLTLIAIVPRLARLFRFRA
ncbi:MAG: hypothetical protein JO354_04400 [Verrucomicrobia bacterium]|nr:hypothetical protein [Verrucomicrobiota bacterium]